MSLRSSLQCSTGRTDCADVGSGQRRVPAKGSVTDPGAPGKKTPAPYPARPGTPPRVLAALTDRITASTTVSGTAA